MHVPSDSKRLGDEMNGHRSRSIPVTLALLAVAGLSIGAALAAPGVASADPSADPYSWTDQLLGGLSVPAETTTSDIQILVDCIPNTLGSFDLAAVFGDMDHASAIGNFLTDILPSR